MNRGPRMTPDGWLQEPITLILRRDWEDHGEAVTINCPYCRKPYVFPKTHIQNGRIWVIQTECGHINLKLLELDEWAKPKEIV